MKFLYKSIKTGGEARKKQVELEKKYGLKLSCYHTGAGWHFLPYVHKNITPNEKHALKVLAVLPLQGYKAISFVKVAELSKLTIREALETISYLAYNSREILLNVGRDGKPISAYKK